MRLPSVGLNLVIRMTNAENPKVVAIVDDDELMRNALQGLMKAVGLRARAYSTAEEFLNSGDFMSTAFLIADIQLPGISGLELQSRLVAEQRSIPIMFITAHGDEMLRAQALAAGAVVFLTKPFDDETLLESIRAALDS